MKISVILFVKSRYDIEAEKRCVYSCINQTHRDWELIVQEFGNEGVLTTPDSRVTRYSELDNGPDDAMLKGWHKATGDLVTWIGADDWFNPHAFKEASDLMRDGTYAEPCAFCGQLDLYQEGNHIGNNGVYYLSEDSFFKDHAHPATSATFFRRSMFKNPDIRNVEFDMWCQAYKMGNILWSQESLANYTVKPDQLSAKNAIKRLQSRLPIMKEYGIEDKYITSIQNKIKFLESVKC